MSRVSVIIPSWKEKYLPETLEDLYEKRTGQIEVIVVLDGETKPPNMEIPEYPRLKVVRHKSVTGMRNCINEAAKIATGKFIMKIDAHCTIGEGWDKVLQSDCEDNWIVVPRRFWFNAPIWAIKDNKPPVDAMSYKYPFERPYKPRLTGRPDKWRAHRLQDEMLIEDMSYQGSCWFMAKKHYERIGGMDPDAYGTFGEEPQELGLKTQLGPWEGKIMRNKRTWYAHWSKPGSHWRADPEEAGRVSNEEFEASYLYAFDYWWHNRWEERAHDFEWLVDKFWPIPRWPEGWRWETKQFNRYEVAIG